MNWTDEALMAFVDGELDAAQRADVERALAGDAVLQARVAKLQAQRRRVSAAYAPVLDEPVPIAWRPCWRSRRAHRPRP